MASNAENISIWWRHHDLGVNHPCIIEKHEICILYYNILMHCYYVPRLPHMQEYRSLNMLMLTLWLIYHIFLFWAHWGDITFSCIDKNRKTFSGKTLTGTNGSSMSIFTGNVHNSWHYYVFENCTIQLEFISRRGRGVLTIHSTRNVTKDYWKSTQQMNYVFITSLISIKSLSLYALDVKRDLPPRTIIWTFICLSHSDGSSAWKYLTLNVRGPS